MSVRRLAEDQVQPANFAFNAENTTWAEKTIKKYPEGRQQSAVIPLLITPVRHLRDMPTPADAEALADVEAAD